MKKLDAVRIDTNESLFTTLWPLSAWMRLGTLWLMAFVVLLGCIGYVIPYQAVVETTAILPQSGLAPIGVQAQRGGELLRLWRVEGARVELGDTLATLRQPGLSVEVLLAARSGRLVNPRLYAVGETVPAARELFRIDPLPLALTRIRLYLKSSERALVRLGLPVRLRLANDSATYLGYIDAIAAQPMAAGYVARVQIAGTIPAEASTQNARVLIVISQTRLLTHLVNKARTFIRF